MQIGYLDENTKNISITEQKKLIEEYIKTTPQPIDIYIRSHDMTSLRENLNSTSHQLIIANILCLGDGLQAIKNHIELLNQLHISVYSIKENYEIKPGQSCKDLIRGLDLAIKIRMAMMSVNITKVLQEKKKAGIKLGRQGCKNKKHLLDNKGQEIKKMLAMKIKISKIAQELQVSPATLYNFLKKHPEYKYQNKGDR